jgi:SAM-dependent methyltransferase
MEPVDSSLPEFWNSRYQAGKTPWDLGRAPADLAGFFKRFARDGAAPARTRVLVPGCGFGHEVKAFAEAGFDFTAVDVAPAAVERTRQLVGPRLAERVVLGDFFTADFSPGSFDLIYERFFLAALPPAQRDAYRDRMAYLLKYGGALAGCFYYQKPSAAGGPPFGLAWGEADELFARYFLLVKDVAITDSLAQFAGRERWQERRRTAHALAQPKA